MKNTFYAILSITLFFAFTINADAAASLSTSTSSVNNGDSFTTTVNLSGVASWNVHVSASGPVSGCSINAADTTSDASNGSKSYSTTCKATGTGTITITLSGDAADANGTKSNLSGTKTVKVGTGSSSSSTNNTKKTNNNSNNNSPQNLVNNNKSNDNSLKSLSVEGYSLTPEFNKDKTEYTVNVENNIKSIKINGEANDSKANIEGLGGKEIKEGNNLFDIIVTAENGDKKTYKLNIIVDTKPITVKINGKEYTIVKNKENLPELKLQHEEITLTIDDQEIPAYRIDSLNIVLVGLKDSKGNIKLYKFDSYKDSNKSFKYLLFRQFNFPEKSIIYLNFPNKLIPKGYKQYKEKINGNLVKVYKINKNSKYCLFYGINAETGKKNIYRYDSKEKTIQIYTNEDIKTIQKQVNEYSTIIVCLIAFSTVSVVTIVILLATRKRKIKKIAKHYKKLLKTYEEKPQ